MVNPEQGDTVVATSAPQPASIPQSASSVQLSAEKSAWFSFFKKKSNNPGDLSAAALVAAAKASHFSQQATQSAKEAQSAAALAKAVEAVNLCQEAVKLARASAELSTEALKKATAAEVFAKKTEAEIKELLTENIVDATVVPEKTAVKYELKNTEAKKSAEKITNGDSSNLNGNVNGTANSGPSNKEKDKKHKKSKNENNKTDAVVN